MVFALILLSQLAACVGVFSGDNAPLIPAPLSADNINLVFVVSPDLAFHAPGDINPDTANLTDQSLQRSLLMATYLKERVLGKKNANRIYALEPMTHLQTANNYPDIAAITSIQQCHFFQLATVLGGVKLGFPRHRTYILTRKDNP